MSAEAQLNELVNTLIESGVNQEKISELQECFNEQEVEIFLEKLATIEGLDALIDETSDSSDQLIDIVSELIISK